MCHFSDKKIGLFDYISDEELCNIALADRFMLLNRSIEQRHAILNEWMKSFLRLSLTMPVPCKGKALFFRSLVRDDYKALFHEIINAAAVPDAIVVEDYIGTQSDLNFDAPRSLSKLGTLSNRLGYQEPLIATACAVRLMQYEMIVIALDAYEFDTLVLFADMQPVEHLAAIYFKAKGKATVTLQHGLYIDYGDTNTINVINYKHQPSDTFLAWGGHTAALINKYHPDTQVIICGKPNLTRLEPRGQYAGNSDGMIVVIMDQEIFQGHNVAMLQIVYAYAAKAGKAVRVRYHPHNQRSFYQKTFPNIIEESTLPSDSVIVGHTSSLLFEAAAIGLPVVQYISDTPTIPLAPELRFTNAAMLETAMTNACKSDRKDHADGLIAAIGDEAQARYRKFFDSSQPASTLPRFSIIVPCYNSGLHLPTALNSILNQSFGDLEVVIADGLSTDFTLQIAMDYTQADPRVKIYSQADKGVYEAMNNGLSRATGEWIIFMGSDDEFADSDVLSKVAAFADANPDAGMIYGSVRVVGDVKWAKDGTIYDGEFSVAKVQTKNICHQAIFYRRSAHEQIGNYNLKYRLCADWDMNLRFWSAQPCKYIDLVVANFNAGGMSTSGTDPEFGKDFSGIKSTLFSQAGKLVNG